MVFFCENNKLKIKMTWIKVIGNILNDPRQKGIPGLKKLVLYSVFACPLAFFIQAYAFMSATTGEIPSRENMVKSVGYFEIQSWRQNGRYSDVAIFHPEKGGRYVILHEFEWPNFENWIKNNRGGKIYVEGFVLKNGSGSFYPVYLKPIDEPALLLPEKAYFYLRQRRSISTLMPFLYIFLSVVGIAALMIYLTKKNFERNSI